MNLTIWTQFTKKKKSTARPATAGLILSVRLKEDTNVQNPHFILHSSSAPSVTYAYVGDWDTYYFVDNVTYMTGDEWDLSLTIDPLATYKEDIGGYTGFILRCSDLTFYNPMITDDHNPPTENIIMGVRTDDIQGIFSDECYVLTLAASADSYQGADTGNGFCRSYVLSPSEMVQVAKKYLDTNFLQQLKNSFSNPMDCVVSCKAMPVLKIKIAGNSPYNEQITVGGESLGASADIVKNRYITYSGHVSLPNKPHGTNSYADTAPYMTISVYLPFVGVVPVDFGIVRATWALNYRLTIDVLTGDVMYCIYADAAFTQLCATYSGNCASECPVSGTNWNTKGYLGGAITAIGGAAVALGTLMSGGALAGVLGGLATMAGGVGAATRSAEIHTQVNGSLSSALGRFASGSITIVMYYKTPSHGLEDLYYVDGLPCQKYGKILDHAGYLLLKDASVPLNGMDSIRDQVNDALNSGFYYE